tara:strand:- start:800 stop:1168 length:369 start_codon:yes stop_codon:yes gene_type:complete
MKLSAKILFFSIIACNLQSCNLLSAAGVSSQGQPTKSVETQLTSTTANSAINIDHGEWTDLLQKHVNNAGYVDYEGFINDRAALDKYLNKLTSLDPDNDWSARASSLLHQFIQRKHSKINTR